MKILDKYDTDYYTCYSLSPNKYGLTHIFHDKGKDEWWLVHATTYRFPMKYENGVVSGRFKFII